ncbi:hypothetical protein ABTK73_20590, partial [Acinetobacter baumannii]
MSGWSEHATKRELLPAIPRQLVGKVDDRASLHDYAHRAVYGINSREAGKSVMRVTVQVVPIVH